MSSGFFKSRKLILNGLKDNSHFCYNSLNFFDCGETIDTHVKLRYVRETGNQLNF